MQSISADTTVTAYGYRVYVGPSSLLRRPYSQSLCIAQYSAGTDVCSSFQPISVLHQNLLRILTLPPELHHPSLDADCADQLAPTRDQAQHSLLTGDKITTCHDFRIAIL
jgi:hypothetical protein